MFTKKTIKDIALTDKRVLLRADYNVPVTDGVISDDYRIKQSVPTIEYILNQKPESLIIISHLGRPLGPQDKSASLKPVARRLGHLLDRPIYFVDDCAGASVREAAGKLEHGAILMLENLRYHPEEEKNDPHFAQSIAEDTGAQVFVQDGFGVVHRAHASTEAITKYLPSVAGLLLEKEVDTITRVMKQPARPLVTVVGGAKISDKIEILETFIKLADCVAVGGAMANDFLRAEKIPVGASLVDEGSVGLAAEIIAKARKAEMERNFSFLLPVDAVVSKSADGRQSTRVVDLASHSLADIEAYPKLPPHSASRVKSDEKILDIGPISAGQMVGAIKLADTVIWNGTLGVTETRGLAGAYPPFSHATHMVVEAIIGASNRHRNKAFSLVGGGDTVSYIEQQKLTDDFSHVSTGGGASLELMTGHKLPGIEALQDK